MSRQTHQIGAGLGLGLALSTLGCHGAAIQRPPEEVTPSPLDAAVATISEGDLATHVQTLASDELAGRFPGTPGEVETLSYVTSSFARARLEAPIDGKFTQQVSLVEMKVDPGATLRFVGGDGPPVTLRWGPDFLASSASGEAEVELHDVPVVFAGYGIEAPDWRCGGQWSSCWAESPMETRRSSRGAR